MFNRKTFPILALASIGAMVFALAFLWALDVDSPTVAEQTASTLTLGIPSGIVLVILIWFGAGIDALLSRIRKKSTRILASLGVYIVLPFTLCIALPALLIIVTMNLAFPDSQTNAGFGTGLFLTLAAIPAVMGFLFIYIGAGIGSLSRWLAGRIWREPEPEQLS
jgi:hypothetical protein